MRLKEITYTSYNLPFKRNFVTAKTTYAHRAGFILKIVDELGNTALGEAAPLVGFGTDTLKDAGKSLQKIKAEFNGITFGDGYSAISDFSSLQKISPTSHFALDQCLLNLYFKRHGDFLSTVFPKRKLKIAVNFVLGLHSVNETISLIKEATNIGFKTYKLKAGRKDFKKDIKIIAAVRNTFDNSINIRIDVNAKWEKEEAVMNISQLEQFNIQYIEQPVEKASELMQLAESASISVAPDESIKTFGDAELFLQNENIKFIVLKPSLLGSIFETLRLITKANNQDKAIIISSAIESAIGRSAVNLIASIPDHQYSHGLETSKFFKTDLTNDHYKIKNGFIDISKYPPEFN